MFKREYEWALAHPDIPACKRLIELARLYTSHQDAPTFGLIEGCIDELRRAMQEAHDD